MQDLTFSTVEELIQLSDVIQPIVNLRLGDILLEMSVITEAQLKKALAQQKKQGHLRIGRIIANMGFAHEWDIHHALMRKFGIPIVNLATFELADDVQAVLPDEFAIVNKLVPLAIVGQRLFLAMPDPLDWALIHAVSEITRFRVEPVMASSSDIREVLLDRRKGADIPKIEQDVVSSEKVPQLISYHFAQQHKVMPIAIIQDRLFLAMANPQDKEVIHEVSRKTGLFVAPILTPPKEVDGLIKAHRNKDIAKVKAEILAEQQTEMHANNQLAELSTEIKLAKGAEEEVKPKPEAQPQPSSLIGIHSVIKDRFQLTEVLGEGGMGMVYRAVDKRKKEAHSDDASVAIKVLSQSFKDHPKAFITMEREASKTQKLSHPNIVTVNDFDRDEDVIYIVMEFLEGQSLSDFILMYHRKGMPVNKALDIVKRLGSALSYAHEKHIIHCDFKPGNAFITKDNEVKVIDFGIARVSSAISKEEKPKFLDDGLLTGCTPSYATPELIFGKDPLPTDDVYALSCTTYKLLTGEHPFNGHSSVEAEKLGLSPKRIKALSRRQWNGLLKGLSFVREERTQTIDELLNDLMPRQISWSSIAIAVLMFSLSAIVVFQVLPFWQLRVADQKIAEIERDELADADLIAAYYSSQFKQSVQERIRSSIRVKLIGKLLYAQGDDFLKLILTVNQLPEADAQKLLNSNGVKQKVLSYYTASIERLVDPKAAEYGFAQAFDLLAQADAMYPEDEALNTLRTRLQVMQQQLVKRLEAKIAVAVKRRQLVHQVNTDNVPQLLEQLLTMQKDHPLSVGGTLLGVYEDFALQALANGDLGRATKLHRVMRRFWPDAVKTFSVKKRLATGI